MQRRANAMEQSPREARARKQRISHRNVPTKFLPRACRFHRPSFDVPVEPGKRHGGGHEISKPILRNPSIMGRTGAGRGWTLSALRASHGRGRSPKPDAGSNCLCPAGSRVMDHAGIVAEYASPGTRPAEHLLAAITQHGRNRLDGERRFRASPGRSET
jgi:hypothetical protein